MYHFSWFSYIADLGVADAMASFMDRDAVINYLGAWFVGFMLIGLSLLARRSLNRARQRGGTLQFVPDRTFTVRNTFEMLIGGLFGLIESILGNKDAKAFFWLVGGLFIYILTANLMGVIPGMLPPTDNMHHNFAMALVVLIVFNVVGISRQRGAYFKHLLGPVWWLAPLILFIEVVSLLVVRPYSLSLRLMGNVFGDHMVFGIMSELIPLLYPCLFLGLGIFVSVIQALVFTLLSTIYIALAVAHSEDH